MIAKESTLTIINLPHTGRSLLEITDPDSMRSQVRLAVSLSVKMPFGTKRFYCPLLESLYHFDIKKIFFTLRHCKVPAWTEQYTRILFLVTVVFKRFVDIPRQYQTKGSSFCFH